MRNKLFFLCGILAHTVSMRSINVGGVKRLRYSRRSHFVSELIEAGAPNTSLLNPLFALYNLLTIAFGIGLFARVRGMSQGKGSGSPEALRNEF